MEIKSSVKQKDQWINLSDINVFQQQYKQNFRSLKYFGLQYLPNE